MSARRACGFAALRVGDLDMKDRLGGRASVSGVEAGIVKSRNAEENDIGPDFKPAGERRRGEERQSLQDGLRVEDHAPRSSQQAGANRSSTKE